MTWTIGSIERHGQGFHARGVVRRGLTADSVGGIAAGDALVEHEPALQVNAQGHPAGVDVRRAFDGDPPLPAGGGEPPHIPLLGQADLVYLVGAGLLFSGLSDTCGMGMILARMPWNHCRQDSCPR